MIQTTNTFRGITAAAIFMVPFYIGLWLSDIGGLGGMMNDDSYPFSTILLPIIAAIFSGISFWVGVFPAAQFSKIMGNKKKIKRRDAGILAFILSILLGLVFGTISGGINAGFWYSIYLGLATVLFWTFSTRTIVEQDSGGGIASRSATSNPSL